MLRQLAEVELAQYQAIAGVTRARVSQIVARTEIPDESIRLLEERWYKMLERPQDHLAAVSKITTAHSRDEWKHRYELVHGSPCTLGNSVPEN